MPALTSRVVPAGTMHLQSQPSLYVDELTLRPWQPSDVPAVVEAYRDPAIQQWHARTMTEDEAARWVQVRAEWWAAETGAEWAVVRDGVLLGRMGLRTVDLAGGLAHAAYWVVPAARGRNVATRALRLMTEWGFTQLGLNRIELEHATANAASCAVAGKAGYRPEGTKRQQALHPDGWHDMHLHARLRNDRP